MRYWQDFPKTTYVDALGRNIEYNIGELNMGEVDSLKIYHYFNGYMLLVVM